MAADLATTAGDLTMATTVATPPRSRMPAFDFGDYGGDADAVGAPEPKELSWREDPETSFSDYTLSILEEGVETATYHVHRCQLAAGRNACDYFRKLLSRGGGQFCERAEGVSKIELNSAAAAAFPSFLDFIYGVPLTATSASAVALLHLANYFGNRALHKAVVAFMQEDLTTGTAAIYLAQAETFKLEKVSVAAFKLCAEQFSTITAESLSMLEPALFARVVQSDDFTCESAQLSLRVEAVCLAHPEKVDGEFLDAVTCADKMPTVDVAAALGLLKQALLHSESGSDDGASLRERCISSLANNSEAVTSIRDPDVHRAKRQRTAETLPLGLPLDVQLEIIVQAFRCMEQRAEAAEKRADEFFRRFNDVCVPQFYRLAKAGLIRESGTMRDIAERILKQGL